MELLSKWNFDRHAGELTMTRREYDAENSFHINTELIRKEYMQKHH